MQDYSILFSLFKIIFFNLIVLLFLLLWCFSKKPLIKPKKKPSGDTVRVLEIVSRVILFFIIIGFFFYASLPTAKDAIWVFKNGLDKIPSKTARVSSEYPFRYGYWWIMQHIYFNDEKSVSYHKIFMNQRVREGEVYKILYLPQSKLILKMYHIE